MTLDGYVYMIYSTSNEFYNIKSCDGIIDELNSNIEYRAWYGGNHANTDLSTYYSDVEVFSYIHLDQNTNKTRSLEFINTDVDVTQSCVMYQQTGVYLSGASTNATVNYNTLNNNCDIYVGEIAYYSQTGNNPAPITECGPGLDKSLAKHVTNPDFNFGIADSVNTEYAEAMALYRSIRRDSTKSKKAVVFANEYNEVINKLENVLETEKKAYPGALSMLIGSYNALGRKKDAITSLQKVLNNPVYKDWQFEINLFLMRNYIMVNDKEGTQAAFTALDKLAGNRDEWSQVLLNKTIYSYFSLDDKEAAEKYYAKLLDQFPETDAAQHAMYAFESLFGQKEISKESAPVLPQSFAVYANYPNPFNPETHIKFDIPESDHVKIEIFDVQGRLVNTLANGQYEAGHHSVTWQGGTAAGTQAASGMYFYRVQYRDQINTQKMLLIK